MPPAPANKTAAPSANDAAVPPAAASDNPTTSPAAPANKVAAPPANKVTVSPLAATRPFPYDPDDRDSILSRYARDRARLDEVLAAGVPVLWVTDAIW